MTTRDSLSKQLFKLAVKDCFDEAHVVVLEEDFLTFLTLDLHQHNVFNEQESISSVFPLIPFFSHAFNVSR
jgi:hypothetical protein